MNLVFLLLRVHGKPLNIYIQGAGHLDLTVPVNISESFGFRSQFEQLFIIFYLFFLKYFFVGIYILNEKVLNKQIRKFKDC